MRCYNGCPDKELQAVLDDNAAAEIELAVFGARATYFPMEERWMVFKDYKPVTDFHSSKRLAANAAINILNGRK